MIKIFMVFVSLLLAGYTPLFGQEAIKLSGQPLPVLEQLLSQTSNGPLFGNDLSFPLLKKVTVSEKDSRIVNTISQAMPLVYAYKDLAIFCKLEVQLEKAVKMPIKFRLGSVDYVDWLEGKRDRY